MTVDELTKLVVYYITKIPPGPYYKCEQEDFKDYVIGKKGWFISSGHLNAEGEANLLNNNPELFSITCEKIIEHSSNIAASTKNPEHIKYHEKALNLTGLIKIAYDHQKGLTTIDENVKQVKEWAYHELI